MALVLGIDTGGTYTDGVVFDLLSNKVLTKAKALTTYDDLAIGIRNCIKSLDFNDFQSIRVVSLSTTLATNAVVEGRGCEVGLILIGSQPLDQLPVQHYAVLQGGHDTNGNCMADLDCNEVRQAIAQFKGKVDAIAISGYFSVRNPEHELQVRDYIRENLDIPVVCGHQLTTTLGYHERTVTAVLNAQLIPVIADLMDSVKTVLKELKIEAELMIVKGDGTLMSEEIALEKPIETILSGPAASLVGATALTGTENALVLDMGGTTTDMAVLEGGVPRVNKQGATVGGWLTRVQAADIHTYGLGGDSYIQINNEGNLVIGPQRVWPLSVAAHEYPYLIEELQEQAGNNQAIPFAQPTDCFILVKNQLPENATDIEKATVRLLESGPHTFLNLAQRLGKDPYFVKLQRLLNHGILVKASTTPTDLLHANGLYTTWSVKAAKLGVEIMARRFGKSPEEFLDIAMEQIIYNSCLAVIESILHYEGVHIGLGSDEAKYFINKVLSPNVGQPISFSTQLNFPVIAIGAPVKAYLPKVADKLNTELIIPVHAEVANAVGAAAGKVVEKIEVLIRPARDGGYILHAPWEYKIFQELEDAKEYALEESKQKIATVAERAGSVDYEVMVKVKDNYLKPTQIQHDVDCDNGLYLETKIEITAVGRPKWTRTS